MYLPTYLPPYLPIYLPIYPPAYLLTYVTTYLPIQIIDGPELWVDNTELSSTLVITEATPQHAGRYTLVVRDRKATVQHTLTLSVIGKLIDILHFQ